MNDMNILTVNGEQYNVADKVVRGKIANDVANVIKETITGTTVSTDKVSSITHDVACKVSGVDDPTAVIVTQNPLGKTFKPNAEGIVTGMKSITPEMTISTDNPSANLEVTYNVDTKKFVEAHSGGGGSAIEHDGAGYHNSVYRGKNFGSAVTPEQYARIKDGTFKDLYIGDYWEIDGVNWRIAAFDYFLNVGDRPCTEHHAVMVPDTILYKHRMNDGDTTSGGYAGSVMYNSGLEQARTTIKSAFPGHVLAHRLQVSNATSQGCVSGTVWINSVADLMIESMVYGCGIFLPFGNGSFTPPNYIVETSQLPLFTFRQDLIYTGQWYWLRDIVSSKCFTNVNDYGNATYYGASESTCGVRPYFCIYGGEA